MYMYDAFFVSVSMHSSRAGQKRVIHMDSYFVGTIFWQCCKKIRLWAKRNDNLRDPPG